MTITETRKISTEPVDGNKIADALAGFFTFATAGLAMLQIWLRRRKKNAKEKQVIDSLEKLLEARAACFAVMNDVVFQSKICDRVIIFSGHNHGGLPSAFKPYFVSSVFGVARLAEQQREISTYKNLEVDIEYIRVLERVVRDKVIHFKVEDMAPSLLKDIYTAAKISESCLLFLGANDNELIYASFARVMDDKATPDYFSANDLYKIRVAGNTLKQNL